MPATWLTVNNSVRSRAKRLVFVWVSIFLLVLVIVLVSLLVMSMSQALGGHVNTGKGNAQQ